MLGVTTHLCAGVAGPVAESPAGPGCPRECTAPDLRGEQRALETVLELRGVEAEARQAL